MVVEFLLLGSLEAVENGNTIPLGGRQQRALLAALLLRPNEAVPADQLIDALWGERPPPTASTIVQLYISRLRKLLGRDRLLTRPSGYELHIDPSQIDAGRFEALLGAAAGTDDAAQTARLLRQALALWRGPALVDFAYDEFAAAESGRFEELRLAALEDRIDADLVLGRDAELVGEIEALLVEQPLRERLRGQLMLALYRSGRQADALEAFREGRRVLVEELGLEPSAALRELERRILDQDPTLEAASRPAPKRSAREERKVVTALFAGLACFRGTALDPEEERAILAPFSVRVRSELERFGGAVESLVGGTVAAVFGVPLAHEDDPERAVRAALACRDVLIDAGRAFPELCFELRIGIATGEALVGGGDGALLGDALSTADRLRASAAANVVLVSEETRRATAEAIAYEAGESTGVWQAVAAKAPIRAERSRARSVALVGRAGELDLIRERLRRAESESSAELITLVGAPGIGKSRLLREVMGAAQEVRWLQGRSIPYGDGVAYWALAEIVKTVAGILDTDAPARAGRKLRQAVEEAVAEERDFVEAQLRVLLGLDAVDLSSGRFAAFTAWHGFLAGLAAKRPLVVALEDIHWADDGLLDFVEHLQATAAGPLLVLCTARPELLERRPAWGPLVELSPLSDEETRTLLSGLLEFESLPDELEAVVSRVAGNPLFAEEYASAIADGQTGGLPVPNSVQQVIAARLDALAAETKALLQDAAVVGEVFWPGALVATSGLDASGCARQLHELDRRDLVMLEPRSVVAEQPQYAFKHALIRDVAYAGIPRAARVAKHRQIAEWIEAHSRDDDVVELVAHHYGSALELANAIRLPTDDLCERAAEAFWRAGERSRHVYANADAAEYFRRALTLLDDVGSADPEWSTELTLAVDESLADVLELSRDYEQGEAALACALELVPARDRVRRARLLRKQASSRQRQRRYREALAALDAAEAALGKRPSGQAWWEERCEIGLGRLELGNYTFAWMDSPHFQDLFDIYGPMIEEHGTARQRSMRLGGLAGLSFARERNATGEQTLAYGRAALAAAQELGDLRLECSTHWGLGLMLLWGGRLDEAEVELTEALALSERTGDLIDRTRSLHLLTLLQRRRGDVAGTRRLSERHLAAAQLTQLETPEDRLLGQANMAWIAWREADYPRAEQLARSAWDGWSEYPQIKEFAWTAVFPLLGCTLRAGRADEARELAELLLEPTRPALPPELEACLREDRLEDACAIAETYGYL